MISVKFWVESDCCDLVDISNALGVPADQLLRKGDFNVGGKEIRKNFFAINLIVDRKDDEWDALKRVVVEFVDSNSSGIRKISELGIVGHLSFVVRKGDFHVGLDFSQEDMRLLGGLGVAIDISVYS